MKVIIAEDDYHFNLASYLADKKIEGTVLTVGTKKGKLHSMPLIALHFRMQWRKPTHHTRTIGFSSNYYDVAISDELVNMPRKRKRKGTGRHKDKWWER